MTKPEIRARIAQRKKMERTHSLESLSAAVVKKIQTLPLFCAAKAVGAYMPLADEILITPLFAELEKLFFIPAFDEASDRYRMARLTPEVKKGRFGILEPVVPAFAAEDELDLILVPGVAFDRSGRRIGRGGGFYDRLLPLYHAIRIGICFDFQCLETLPVEDQDIPMDFMITETQSWRVNS